MLLLVKFFNTCAKYKYKGIYEILFQKENGLRWSRNRNKSSKSADQKQYFSQCLYTQ